MTARERSSIIAAVIHKAGGVQPLARKLGITRGAIYQWEGIPADRVEKIAEITGISKETLRPDIYSRGPISI